MYHCIRWQHSHENKIICINSCIYKIINCKAIYINSTLKNKLKGIFEKFRTILDSSAPLHTHTYIYILLLGECFIIKRKMFGSFKRYT